MICSDAMARGMDLSSVEHVMNYDPPVHPRTYVHRAGRTARAGAPGTVYTLLRHQEARYFKGMVNTVDPLPLVFQVLVVITMQ